MEQETTCFKVGQKVAVSNSNSYTKGVIESINYTLLYGVKVRFNDEKHDYFSLKGFHHRNKSIKIKPLDTNDYFKEGDTVYCALFGAGVVESVKDCEQEGYPIKVYFHSTQSSTVYKKDGRYLGCSNVTLSQKPIPPIINTPLPNVFNLSFAEAMEAVKAGKKVMCERWDKGEYIVLEGSYVTKKQPNMSDYYEIYTEDLNAKWCIV